MDSKAQKSLAKFVQIWHEFPRYIGHTFDFDPYVMGVMLKEVEAALRKLMFETQWVLRNWVFS